MKKREIIRPASYGVFSSDSGFSTENRDCTVRALANAKGISYIEAHDSLRRHGRKSGHGCRVAQFKPAYEEHGFVLEGVYGTTTSARIISNLTKIKLQRGISIKRILPKLTGRHIVIRYGHAFAVVNSKIIDFVQNTGASSVVAVFTLKEDK